MLVWFILTFKFLKYTEPGIIHIIHKEKLINKK